MINGRSRSRLGFSIGVLGLNPDASPEEKNTSAAIRRYGVWKFFIIWRRNILFLRGGMPREHRVFAT